MRVFSCDPGTGKKSPAGFSAFDPVSKDIFLAVQVGTDFKLLHNRIRDISDRAEIHFHEFDLAVEHDRDVLFCLEHFVMQGVGGQSLQRFCGSILGRLPYAWKVVEVSNTKMKKALGGHGHAEKSEVARGVYEFFKPHKKSAALIEQLIIRGDQWDVLDAFGIGIAGYWLEQGILK